MEIAAFHGARRIIYCVLVSLVPLLGIGIRANSAQLPEVFVAFAPDVLWAFLVFALGVAVAPHLSTVTIAAAALILAFFMEFSQLYQALWIRELRATKIGALLLGFGFLWSDLVCYLAGVALGMAFDLMLRALLLRLDNGRNKQL